MERITRQETLTPQHRDDAGKKHIIQFSGGKDSSAMLVAMLEKGHQIDRVTFADTLLEFEEIYEHIRWMDNWLIKHGLRVETIEKSEIITTSRSITMDFGTGETKTFLPGDKDTRTFDDWFYSRLQTGFKKGEQRGWPKVNTACWWMRESKVKPLSKTIGDNIPYIGFAADETSRLGPATSHARFPLIEWGWTEEYALKYLDKNNISKPIHHKFARTGCYLCPHQRPESLRTLYLEYPELWKVLREYDNDSPHTFSPRYSLDDIEQNTVKKCIGNQNCNINKWIGGKD